MGILAGVKTVFQGREIPDYSGFYDDFIVCWKTVYSGKADWLTVKKSGLASGNRQMASMNAAKVVCSEMANLTFSEQVNITIDEKIVSEKVNEVLQDNAFWRCFPENLEYSFAEGGGVLKTYLSDGAVRVDYVEAYSFLPTAWNNKRITEGIFMNRSVKGKNHYTLLEWHHWDYDRYLIKNELYRSQSRDEVGVSVDLATLYPALSPESVITGLTQPLFSYYRPNIANNFDTSCPLGISIFANALDTLKTLDIAFDSFQREFILGKKRIIVPASAVKLINDPSTGEQRRYFDANDEVYQAMFSEDHEQLKIYDNTVELRVEDHVGAINALLNILCMQTGLSAGSLSFDGSQGIKSATEVVSQNSKTYRTKQSHQNLFREAIEDTIHNIIALLQSQKQLSDGVKYTVTIQFDDSIIVDRGTERLRDKEDVRDQIMQPWEYRMKWYGEDKDTAQKMVASPVNDDANLGYH